MSDELEILRRYSPSNSGPSDETTARAEAAFGAFIGSQVEGSRGGSIRKRWRRHPVAIAGVSLLLVAAGGIGIAISVDGVEYIDPPVEISQIGDFTLVVQDSNLGQCLEVRAEDGRMSGGCGVEFGDPIGVGLAGFDETTIVLGWAPFATTRLEMTFSSGESVELTEFQRVEGYDIVFFVMSPVPTLNGEMSLPLEVVSYDIDERILATTSYER